MTELERKGHVDRLTLFLALVVVVVIAVGWHRGLLP